VTWTEWSAADFEKGLARMKSVAEASASEAQAPGGTNLIHDAGVNVSRHVKY